MYKLICEIITGSRLYGINVADSDYDYVGVCLPPLDSYLSNNGFEQFNSIKQADIIYTPSKIAHPQFGATLLYEFENPENDRTIYGINKAVKLCIDCNPNMLDLLYARDSHWIHMDPIWEKFIDNRDLFLSKKAKFTFSGYAFAQLKRLKNHKKWIDNPPKKPNRDDYKLVEEKKWFNNQVFNGLVDNFKNFIADEVTKEAEREAWVVEDKDGFRSMMGHILAQVPIAYWRDYSIRFFNSVSNIFIKEEYHDILLEEFRYYMDQQDYQAYRQWLKGRNPERFETERKFGFDVKHAGHLVRLLLMAEEILLDKTITLPLKKQYREVVMEIRNGLWKYENLIPFVEELNDNLEELYIDSTLQNKPQRGKIDELLMQTLHDYFGIKK